MQFVEKLLIAEKRDFNYKNKNGDNQIAYILTGVNDGVFEFWVDKETFDSVSVNKGYNFNFECRAVQTEKGRSTQVRLLGLTS